MRKVVFVAKTNLINDGRILNQIKILQRNFDVKMDFLLLPDKPFNGDLGERISVKSINLFFRNSTFLRPFTVLEFIFKCFLELYKLKPDVMHVHDLGVVIPCYLYGLLRGNKVYIIYDDHEMPNENEGVQYRIMQYFERRLMKKANKVIYANQERREIIDKELNINNSDYFLNLPYFEDEVCDRDELSIELMRKLEYLNELKNKGNKLIMHQGSLEVERGRAKLAKFSTIIKSENIKILVIGVSEEYFENYLKEYGLDSTKFFFIGFVPYSRLEDFWLLSNVSIVMYLPNFINNRLCAPNRYFLSLKYNVPTLVNKDNPVLSNLTVKYNSGFYIEDVECEKDLDQVLNHTYYVETLGDLMKYEIDKFIKLYKDVLQNVKNI